eukprot:TRINITY_DN8823_c0_g1_i1.p1 TRINITY_DN8823_c0_g1~~TRINITY_DN8823_c0_g1_i1.p1  ORF type:complete len:528 (-),score=145.59 TRINITY_DN8823_c0_g1_i1:176-1759(-)
MAFNIHNLVNNQILSYLHTGNPLVDGLLLCGSAYAFQHLVGGQQRLANAIREWLKPGSPPPSIFQLDIMEFNEDETRNPLFGDVNRFLGDKYGSRANHQTAFADGSAVTPVNQHHVAVAGQEPAPRIGFGLKALNTTSTLTFTFEGAEVTVRKTETVYEEKKLVSKGCISLSTLIEHSDKLRNLCADARAAALALARRRDNLQVFVANVPPTAVKYPQQAQWMAHNTQHLKRTLDTVSLSAENRWHSERVLQTFFEDKNWYSRSGTPYRLGIMLWGPPGTGKSSFASGLAWTYHRDVYVLQLNKMTSDDVFIQLVRQMAGNSILLLEDFDAMNSSVLSRTASARQQAASKGKGVSLSTLLNVLDGPLAKEGQVVVLTTNHIEKLDKALFRPGRCDLVLNLKESTPEQFNHMFRNFFNEDVPADLLKKFQPGRTTPAKVAEILRFFKTDAKRAAEAVIRKNEDPTADIGLDETPTPQTEPDPADDDAESESGASDTTDTDGDTAPASKKRPTRLGKTQTPAKRSRKSL